MFGFTRYLGRGRFALAMTLRLAILAAGTVAFPYLAIFFIRGTGVARHGGGGAGALAVVLSLYLKPLLYLSFCALMVRPAARRAASVGISGALCVGVALLILRDLPFGVIFGAHWGLGFVLGAPRFAFPWMLVAAWIAVLTLLALRDAADERRPMERWGFTYGVWLGLFCLMAAWSLAALLPALFALATGKFTAIANSLVIISPIVGVNLSQWLAILFVVASIWLVAVDWLSAPPPGASSVPPRAPSSGHMGRRAVFGRRDDQIGQARRA